MAKAKKKKAKKKAAQRVFVLKNPKAPPPPGMPAAIAADLDRDGDRLAPVPEGLRFFTAPPRKLSLPELWPQIENPVAVRFLEKMRADTAPEVPGGRKRPAMLARVLDVGAGDQEKDLALSAPLAAVFAAVPADGYVGRAYRLTRHRKHERKNASGYTVEEISI